MNTYTYVGLRGIPLAALALFTAAVVGTLLLCGGNGFVGRRLSLALDSGRREHALPLLWRRG